MFEIKTNPIITIDGYDVKILKDICRFATQWIDSQCQSTDSGGDSSKINLACRLNIKHGEDLALIRQMLTRVRFS